MSGARIEEPGRLVLSLEGFEGPLDLLLDLARQQKLDIAKINVLALVDQYLAVIEGARSLRLELAADWLVMAAWLAWLKSRLLLPAEERPPEEEDPEAIAGRLAERLAELDAMRRGAAWLARRPQLGQEVFARGAPDSLTVEDRSRIAADLPGLIRAYLAAEARAARARAGAFSATIRRSSPLRAGTMPLRVTTGSSRRTSGATTRPISFTACWG